MPADLRNTLRLVGLVALAMAAAVALPASAAVPDHTCASYPDTFWARIDYTNTVTGKVIASSDASLGLEGAYVAIVNASDVSVEYCNTTSDADGVFSFKGVNATYYQKLDADYDPLYRLYGYKEGVGEAYTTAFGIDVAAIGEPMVMWVVIPVNNTTARTEAPTATPTPSPSPVPATATPVPGAGGWPVSTIAIYLAVIAAVLVLAVAYIYIRRR